MLNIDLVDDMSDLLMAVEKLNMWKTNNFKFTNCSYCDDETQSEQFSKWQSFSI